MQSSGIRAIGHEEIEAARARVGGPARRTIDRVRALADRGLALVRRPDELRAAAAQVVDELTAGEVRERLGAMPVATLRGVAGKGVRLGRLEQAGYRTVADVHGAAPWQLQAVPGVGPQSAQQLGHAARVVAERVRGEVRVRLDPDRQPAGHTRLLAVLAAIRRADEAAAALRAPLQAFTAATGPLIPDAERATSRLTMFLSRGVRKTAALTALAGLDAALADPATETLHGTIARHEAVTEPLSQQLWREYVADAASVNALLSTIGGAADDSEAAQGFITPELRQRISAVPLDTSLVTATLRGYQVFGAQYAIHQQRSMLGDEMGLGKTVQALAAMAHLAAKGQRRFLVVCPTSVLVNWLNEIGKHTRLTGYGLHGPLRSQVAATWLRDGGVAVTTFGTLGRLTDVQAADVAMLVVDEAHFVKNPDAARSRLVERVARQAQRAFYLTGTPMENRVEEFRNLVHHLQPRIAATVDAGDAVAGARAFRRAVAPVYLRRNQEDVLTELPDKIEVEDWVQPTPADHAAYVRAVREGNIMAMRQAAFRAPESAKLERLREIVTEARDDGMKVVVFSFFLGVLATIQRTLADEVPVTGVITGAVPAATRQSIVDRFTRDDRPTVLLSQIDAGGVGLNIQAAAVVILAEPQWKPSTEHQAIARAHRMGQVRRVQVHRILAKGTVDERLRELQQHKSLLFDEFARRSDAKDADPRAVDRSEHHPAVRSVLSVLDDDTVPAERRVIVAEQHRLGLGKSQPGPEV